MLSTEFIVARNHGDLATQEYLKNKGKVIALRGNTGRIIWNGVYVYWHFLRLQRNDKCGVFEYVNVNFDLLQHKN